jgi:mono/diheme cytochrome c family protein
VTLRLGVACIVALLVSACSEQPSPPASAASASPSASSSASPADNDARASLAFSVEGKPVRSLTKRELGERIPTETFTVRDPYYNKKKTFRALPLRRVLELGFEGQKLELPKQHFVLRAIDGYTVPIDGTRLYEEGAYMAIADHDVPAWEPIGPQQANPGPFYVVWRGDKQLDPETYPRPWQLATIEISAFEKSFPRTVPAKEEAGSAAMRGFGLFREQCIRCHSVNRQGGRVGPDLNVPQSIVEYRPEPQIRAYIKNPATFRYGNMPANPHLTEANLDDILAYFKVMSHEKQDADGSR